MKKKRSAAAPVEDLKRLQALEDAEDVAEAEAALKEYRENGKSISHHEMRKLTALSTHSALASLRAGG